MEKKYGYLVIDKSKVDFDRKYRFQLEIEIKKPAEITENPIMKNILSQIEDKKERASKTCKACNLTMLSSSYAKHIKSKVHLRNSIV